MSNTNRSRSTRFLLQTLAVGALGAILSVLAYVFTRPEVLRFDENYYFPLAQSIITGTYNDGYVIRPPLYTLFLAGIFRLFGTGFGGILLIQSLLRGGLIAGIAFMGRRYVSPFAGLIAGFLLAIYPLLIWTYTRFVSEIAYIPLFVLSFYFLEKAITTEKISHTFAAGIVSGLSALARSTSLFFTVLIAIWLIIRKSSAGRFSRNNIVCAVLLIVALLVAISPWTIRNALVHKAFIPVDNTSAFNLWLITSGKKIQEATEDWTSWGSHAQRQDEGYRRWLEYVKKDPAFHFRRMKTVLPQLFNPFRQPAINSLSTITRGGGNWQNLLLRRILSIVVPVTFWLIIAGGMIQVVSLQGNTARRTLLLILVVYFILVHGATLARPRFLLPMTVLLSIYSGAFIEQVLSRLGWTRPGRP